MTTLTPTKKPGKSKQKPSRFQKLWDTAERLQRQNSQLRTRLDSLIDSAEQLIRPVEKEAAEADLPLLCKLLTLGQRKSLAKWERSTLDEWIRELITTMQTFAITNRELLDHMARYDAFRLGIELEENAEEESGSPYEQMTVHFENMQREAIEAAKQQEAQDQADLNQLQDNMDALVEKILDERLGPPPQADNKHAHTNDFFQDELDTELEKQTEAYQAQREALRTELLEELKEAMRDDFGDSPFDDENLFSGTDYNFEEETPTDPNTPKIDNQTFHKMFRATAAKLHPDREPDPELHKEKHRLMAELLNARKKGDLLTVFRMYQQYTDSRESFSKTDEKQLTKALTTYIAQLEDEKDQIISQSPMHFSAFRTLYHSSKKKQQSNIDNHIKEIRRAISASQTLSESITSLKSLKPWLDARYEHDMMLRMEEGDFAYELRNNPL